MQGDGVLQTRRSVFEALLQLVPSAEVSTSERSVSFLGPYVAGSDFGNEVLGAAEYVSFYQALVPEIAPEAYADRFCTPSHGVPVPIDPSVPISAHAKVLWRAQFEHAAKRDPAGGLPVRLDRDILRSFRGFGLLSNGLFSTTVAPVGLMTAVWNASVQIATAWRALVIDSQERAEACFVGLKATDFEWGGRLGCWSLSYYNPIGVVHMKATDAAPSQLCFVLAS